DRRIPGDADAEEWRGGRALADRHHRRALGDESHLRAGAVTDIDTAGGEGLRHLTAAAEILDLQREPVLFEDSELVADIDWDDRVRRRIRLSDVKRRV